MSTPARVPRLLLAVFTLAGASWATVGRSPGAFTPYTSRVLPKGAQADFDGDGRPDTALIQDGANGSQISIGLSTSSGDEYLSADIGSLITGDIDGDGDLDLVGGAPSGQITAWLNDGHGHFTLTQAKRSDHISLGTMFVDPLQSDPVTLGVTVPLVVPRTRNKIAMVVTLTRPPTGPSASGGGVLSLSSPRAPPVSPTFA